MCGSATFIEAQNERSENLVLEFSIPGNRHLLISVSMPLGIDIKTTLAAPLNDDAMSAGHLPWHLSLAELRLTTAEIAVSIWKSL